VSKVTFATASCFLVEKFAPQEIQNVPFAHYLQFARMQNGELRVK
jgi:hypothetical protein